MRIRDDLLRRGATPWIDAVDLRAGENWSRSIEKALRECSHAIILLSNHSVSKRGYVQKEVARALELLQEIPPDSVFIIPVRIDDCEPNREEIKRLHWVDLFAGYEEGMRKIAKSLGLPEVTLAWTATMIQPSPKVASQIPIQLSTRAVELLIAASSSPTGEIYRHDLDEALVVKANDRAFRGSDGRERAELEGALEELEDEQLITDTLPPTRTLFQMTRRGYRFADRLADRDLRE